MLRVRTPLALAIALVALVAVASAPGRGPRPAAGRYLDTEGSTATARVTRARTRVTLSVNDGYRCLPTPLVLPRALRIRHEAAHYDGPVGAMGTRGRIGTARIDARWTSARRVRVTVLLRARRPMRCGSTSVLRLLRE